MRYRGSYVATTAEQRSFMARRLLDIMLLLHHRARSFSAMSDRVEPSRSFNLFRSALRSSSTFQPFPRHEEQARRAMGLALLDSRSDEKPQKWDEKPQLTRQT